MAPIHRRHDDPEEYDPEHDRKRGGHRLPTGPVVTALIGLAVGLAAGVLGLKSAPGQLMVGSGVEVAQLQRDFDTLNKYTHAADGLFDQRLRADEQSLARLAGFADAVTREKCSTFGPQRAKAWGYDCDGAIAPLPSRP